MSSDPVQEIKARINIEDIVATYLPLKKAGKYLKANCPFHNEKTPSFFVNPERQIAYCFSCQKGGDLFQFVQEIEGIDFKSALEMLGEKAGVEIGKTSLKGKVSKDEKERLKLINQDVNNFFIHSLWNTDSGAKVLSYLHARGLKDQTIKTFQIGLALDSSKDELYRAMLDKKHSKEDLLTSTVVVARDSEAKNIADRFHLRLMIPIKDVSGSVIAFGGRALKKGDNPKYLNSPEYSLYNKSSVLYNLSDSKTSIKKEDFAIVVEGYFDVIASHQAGVTNVVASCGTALTKEQFTLLKRYTNRVYLAFDSDEAGQSAMLRAVHLSASMEMEIFVIQIPEGKDPADAVKENPDLWVNAVKNAKPYLDFYLNFYEQKFNLKEAQGKKYYADAIFDLLKNLKHPVERDHYLKVLSQKLSVPLESLYEHLGSSSQKAVKHKKILPNETKAQDQDLRYRLAFQLIGMILAHPKEFFDLWKEFEKFENFENATQNLSIVARFDLLSQESYENFYKNFADLLHSDLPGEWGNLSSIYKQIATYYNHRGNLDVEFFEQIEDGEKLNKIAFESEVKMPQNLSVRDEFNALIARLYFLSPL